MTPIEKNLMALIPPGCGDFALYAKNLTTLEEVGLNANKVTATASCIKLFILIELARQADAQEIGLSETVRLSASDLVGGSGVLKFLSDEASLSLRDIAMFMMSLSDNSATNILIDRLGIDKINATAHAIGCTRTELRTRIDFDAIGNDIARLAVSTPSDFGLAMQQIAMGTLFSAQASHFVRDIMSTQQHLDLIPRYLPYNQYARDLGLTENLSVANKTGFFPGFRGDVAIIRAGDADFVIALFAENCRDTSFQVDHEAAICMGRIGKAVVEHFHTVTLKA
jgi:beta-lactamase class A